MLPAGSRAESLETVLMPGKVIEGHADLEGDCKNCHARFKKSAQSALCLDCHKDVARDVSQKQGHHGRLTEQECRACHTEHKGRAMNIAPVNEKSFDHKLTDFLLKGGHAHAKVLCRDCHKPEVKFRDAPSDCFACHRKDDTHKGSLGTQCADCHDEVDWKKTRFDHGKTKFPLTGKHRDVTCKDCHADPKFKGAPTACVACHKKDDDHKGRYGTKCESCHSDRDWKTSTFNHDRDTKYALRGKHIQAKCDSCHSGFLYQEKLKTACVACHKADDDKKGHKGRFGEKCQSCHTEKDWGITIFNHDRDTKYPLRGKHVTAKCDSCHTGIPVPGETQNRLCRLPQGRRRQERPQGAFRREVRILSRREKLEDRRLSITIATRNISCAANISRPSANPVTPARCTRTSCQRPASPVMRRTTSTRARKGRNASPVTTSVTGKQPKSITD